MSDIGIETSTKIIDNLRTRIKKEKIEDEEQVKESLREEIEKILEISNLNVMVFSQKKESLDRYIKYKENASSGELNKLVPVIGKYMDQSKYNLKNIMKF